MSSKFHLIPVFTISSLLLSFASLAQEFQSKVSDTYSSAYQRLEEMLSGERSYNFKEAVLLTENAYLDNTLDSVQFNSKVHNIVKLVKGFIKSNELQYNFKDKEKVSQWAAIFKVLTDTIYYDVNRNRFAFLPYIYDFDDIFGDKNWSQMFVSKLLQTGSGNCHSLPYLYKIVAEELGTTATLALAPNHIYIKHKCLKSGMYNTELTSASFPVDAWIMASGYIHLTAIQNGVYMKSLNNRESIALCMIDLAEGYKRKVGNADPAFIVKCCDKALEYFPNYVNAIILKAETIKGQREKLIKENQTSSGDDNEKAKNLFIEMQSLYVKVHKLGYRQMPKDMYLKWLIDLKTEKEKYYNKSVSSYNK